MKFPLAPRHIPIRTGHRHRQTWALVVAAAVLALLVLPAQGQVQLKSRAVQASAKSTDEFQGQLKLAPRGNLYGLATFAKHPDAEERQALKAAGILVLTPFHGTTYRVRVEKRADLRAAPLTKLQAHFVTLNAEDRVSPEIWREDYTRFIVTPPGEKARNYVINRDSTLNLTVRFHEGVPEREALAVLKQHASKYEKQSEYTWVAVVPRANLRALAADDQIQWIDAGPPPSLPDNDNTRIAINVDALQNFNAATGQVGGLGGNGVQVGVFDNGIDETHGDFGNRVIRNDAGRMAHATHVAGTIAGSGALSNGRDSWGNNNGGAAFQWRGMAPLAQLIDTTNGNNGATTATHWNYINTLGMDVSNHSYSFSFDGDYDNSNQTRDQIIRGDAVSGTNHIPPRLHVYSAGNHGNFPNNGGQQVGYFALTKQVKNGLIVGNWDAANNRIAQTSSLGPAYDGRIKPDVVAPGQNVMSTGYCDAVAGNGAAAFCTDPVTGAVRVRQNFYRFMSGTSMAAPAVTGALALVLERYAGTYNVNLDQNPPLPSTLRALMIHTARDIQAGAAWFNNPDGAVQPTAGPDFVTGWGLIDAQAAANTVANRLLLEGSVSVTCKQHSYWFQVPAGAAGVRVTLAWDDVEGNPALPDTSPKLVNDLDLILVDPNGQTHYPWQLDQTILDANGNVLANNNQQCGTQVTVQRQFLPTANPVYIGPGNPNNVNDPIPAGGIPAAGRGRDHLNNVEVVDAPAVAGLWTAKVIGFNVPQGPQTFSLVGQSFTGIGFNPIDQCVRFPKFCGVINPPNFCKRYPKLCATHIVFPTKDGIRLQFTDLREKFIIPLEKVCLYALNCPGCQAAGRCAGFDVRLTGMPVPLGIEIYSSLGRVVARDLTNRRDKQLHFDARPGEEYFLVFSAGRGTKTGMDYPVGLTIK